MNETILKCENLSKSYQDASTKIEVLKNVSFSVMRGELVSIVGTSGSGKSTLLHLLGGLDKPTTGEVWIANNNLAKLTEKKKCKLRNESLGFVYQFHHLLPEFTSLENVAMPLLIGDKKPKYAEDKAAHILEVVGLKERLQHKVGQLSGGERQRVAIARALVNDPLCVLADEPTGNLDPGNANKVLELFFDLQKSFKASIVIVTHDQSIANRTDKTYKLDNGTLVSLEGAVV